MITAPAENKAIGNLDVATHSRKSYVCLKCNATFSTAESARECGCEKVNANALAETEKAMLNQKGF